MLSAYAGTTGNSLKSHAFGVRLDSVDPQRGYVGDQANAPIVEEPAGARTSYRAAADSQPFSSEEREAAWAYLDERLNETHPRATKLRTHEHAGGAPESLYVGRYWTSAWNNGGGQ
ncbi:hypothetical protein PD653_2634 [Nocardioides sp. PD653]|nr:hypothetical protein PD653B2_1319 [Nocardioides sp. PD653-B2]GAW55214.1 hypothetical protein PD653_2634 [Nocardioides sp. PD653]